MYRLNKAEARAANGVTARASLEGGRVTKATKLQQQGVPTARMPVTVRKQSCPNGDNTMAYN